MIPKINYQIHEILTDLFLPPFKKKKDFDKESKKFIQHFKKIEKEVLTSIEKFSGFRWSKRTIPVYIIPQNKSITSLTKSNLNKGFPGVVQKVYENIERCTHIFIHELTHVNQFQSDFYSKKNLFVFNKRGVKNTRKIELCSDVVCVQVIRDLFGNKSIYEKDYWIFQNKIRTSSPGIEKEIPIYLKKWDLNEKTLREYILKSA